MIFFKKLRLTLFFKKMSLWFLYLPIAALLAFSFARTSLNNGKSTGAGVFFILIGIAVIITLIVVIAKNFNSNEYRELIRQAKIIGDLDTVGKTIDSIENFPTLNGILRFNQDLIFHSDVMGTKIIIPSSITEISTSVFKSRVWLYNVHVRCKYENGISISMSTEEAAKALCDVLKKSVAPHLLESEANNKD